MPKKRLFSTIVLACLISLVYLGCQKTDHPFGVYAPYGLDVPTWTPTPALGSFNCYVYDGSPKMGVTVNLVDPAGNTVDTRVTDQFGNAPFSPYPLVAGTYSANVPNQGRYGYSSLPITVASSSQGAVSIQFWAGNQALTITGGAPVSFLSGTGAFPMTLAYIQPGTLDVPVSITHNTLPAAWSASPATFVMNMAVSTMAVTVNKVSCAVLNQPVTWMSFDFLGLDILNTSTTIMRNFPVNVILSAATTNISCVSKTSGRYNTTFTLSSSNDCGLSWYISGSILGYAGGGFISPTSISTYLSNNGSYQTGDYSSYPLGNASCTNPPANATSGVTISSPLGTAIGSGFSGNIINATF